MTITAKYPGKCSVCGRAFAAGAQIEWSKGAGSKHAACAAGAAPARESTPKTSRAQRAPKAIPAGPALRNDKDPYHLGDVLVRQLTASEITACESRQGLTATEIPGPACRRPGDRRVAVVVVHTDRMRQEDADDNGYCGRYGATVRLATADEAAPVLAARTAKLAGEHWSRFVGAWVSIGDAVRAAALADHVYVETVDPADRIGAVELCTERRGLHGAISARWSRLIDGSIMHETWRYDDDRCGRWVTVDQLVQIALHQLEGAGRTLEEAIRGQRYSAVDRAIVMLEARGGRTPRPPVTVTLHGLDAPVTLELRLISASGMVCGEILGGGSVQVPERGSVVTRSEWAWPISRLREQLAATPPTGVFSGIEFAPGAELGADRLPLPEGLWIEGMRAALAQMIERTPVIVPRHAISYIEWREIEPECVHPGLDADGACTECGARCTKMHYDGDSDICVDRKCPLHGGGPGDL